MRRYLLLLFGLHFSVITIVAQSIDTQKLDSLFTILSNKNLAMGSIAISRNGKLVYERAIGNARMDSTGTIAASQNTEYRIGSITKMFTATMIFQFLEEKRLSLDEKLSSYFPQLPNAGRITIGNMLYHRSGLHDFTKDTNFDDWKDKSRMQAEIIALIGSKQPDFEPNARADYNNSNYFLLGCILEKISKKPYSILVGERVISKIGLTQTYYQDNAALRSNESSSYKYFDNKWVREKDVWLDDFGGAGALQSTPADLTRFINALFSGKLISKASLDKIKTMVDGYGMGIFPKEFDTHHGLGHDGKTEGYASALSYYPEDKLAIAYCTNGEVYPKEDILQGVLSICFSRPYTLPTFSPILISDSLLDRYTGSYSAASLGITATVTRNGSGLILDTRGQKFDLLPLDINWFWNQRYGFFFVFNNGGKQLLIIDTESVYELARP